LIATTNPGKVREFREMLGAERFEWSDLSQHRGVAAPDETGQTFEENARLKAAYYAKLFGMAAIADDSGLEVDALGSKPGVHSARWAEMNGAGKGDGDNNVLLLRQLQGVADERRTARFVCVLALADREGRVVLTARGVMEGRIIHEPRGANGFGYDPLFLVEGMGGRTTAELPPREKHTISHRGQALRILNERLDRLNFENPRPEARNRSKTQR
jgi:XTP/dITP diphosphohydrolase